MGRMAELEKGMSVMSRYKKIKLKDGTTRDEHRLVMESIIGRKLTFNEVVHHKNEDKSDNDPGNLEVEFRANHSRKHMKKYSQSPTFHLRKYSIAMRKLTDDQVRQIRLLKQLGYGSKKLSRMFGVSRHSIKDLLTGKTYKDVI